MASAGPGGSGQDLGSPVASAGGVRPGGSALAGPAGSPSGLSASDRSVRLPANTATGVSVGYPAYPGLFLVTPADGSLAFRSGLTGFPTLGLLWTPGLEYRFGQEPGTLSVNGLYVFGNAFLGRTYLDGEKDYAGMEAGLGVRWIVDDRRDVRWIAAVEAGGYWRGDPIQPRHPCLRFIWTMVD